jgi:hypothetical protein
MGSRQDRTASVGRSWPKVSDALVAAESWAGNSWSGATEPACPRPPKPTGSASYCYCLRRRQTAPRRGGLASALRRLDLTVARASLTGVARGIARGALTRRVRRA